jgi:BirA family transcriptional regulator, biotin operon repressor / biotin---[acetyl-CoA-carboxylase] ligase
LPQPYSHIDPETPFIELQTVDSTNNYALKQLHAGLTRHGTAYFTREQTSGKGQRGNTWLAAKDSSLLLSIVINPKPLTVNQQFQLSACVAVSVCRFFNNYVNGNARIKWPNDLYWQDRKAGGILIDNIIGSHEGGWQWAVIGIGININQTFFPENLKNPVSLKQITGNDYVPVEMARELCFIVENNFKGLIASGFDDLYSSYLTLLYKKNETSKLKTGGRVFEGIIKTVSPAGALIVEHGIEEEFEFGEIDWVIPGQ